jgi:hypothetical protein
MRDAETHVFHDGKHPERPVPVHIQEGDCEIVLYFRDLSGEGEVLALEINPRRASESLDEFEPAKVARTQLGIDPAIVRRVGRNYSTYVAYARALLQFNRDRARETLRALRATGRTRRGLSPDFLSVIATDYCAARDIGDPHPLTTLAEKHGPIALSTASRWVKRCRELGLLD